MTDSFFLIHLIDKDDYNGIYALYQIPHDLLIKGMSRYYGDTLYIQMIESEPERNGFHDFSIDSSSIWLGVGIIPKETFEENVELFKDLCSWIMDFLYLSRFLVNLNLKARVFFHVENYNEELGDSNLSFQRSIDINCDSGSLFQVNYNRYDLMFPLLTKLLQYKPTEKLRAIIYNYATSKVGHSGVIDYFFSFATFEGIVHNWAESKGYSQLWGTAVANSNEQETLHENLRSYFTEFINNHASEDDKKKQLVSFRDSTFPSNRKIMRTLKQRFKSYYENRLTDELRENEYIQTLLNNFQRIYPRRNEIGHSLETYLRTPGLIEDVNTLMSSIKIIMDFELNKFLTGEMDWKFEVKVNDLRKNLKLMNQSKVLDKFTYNVEVQNNIQLTDRFGSRNIEKLEFHSGMIKKNSEDDDELPKPLFSQRINLTLPQNFSRRIERNTESGIVNAYEDPYWWISTTQKNSHYIIKTFSPTTITTTSNKVYCNISSENILSVVKLDFVDIPDDLDIFSIER